MKAFKELYREWSRRERIYAVALLIIILTAILSAVSLFCTQNAQNRALKCTAIRTPIYLIVGATTFIATFYMGEKIEKTLETSTRFFYYANTYLNDKKAKFSTGKEQKDSSGYSYKED